MTNAAGEYTIVALPSGTYSVSFSPTLSIFGAPGGGNYLSQTQNSVTVASVTAGIDAALLTGGQISGKVTDASAKPLAYILVCAIEPPGACQLTNSADEYTMSGLSGSYDVVFIPGLEAFFGAPAGNYLIQFNNGKSSIAEAQLVSVTAPNTVSNINAALQPGGQISGTVTDALTHAPLANIEACSVPSGFGSCATTNATGQYTISGLVSGEYNVESRSNGAGNYMPELTTMSP